MSYPKRSKTSSDAYFLDPATLAEAADQIAACAAKVGVRLALAGGYALQLYGSRRLTGDLDFIADGPIRGLPREGVLSFGGRRTLAPNGVPVDIILRDDDYESLYDEALAHAQRLRSSPVRVVRPEYLAAMKMASARAKDVADLEFLLASKTADVTKVRRIVRKHLGPYAATELDALAAEVAWKASRGLL